jgi:hypothetical protein
VGINMALINCPECNKEISDKAESCPNCGCPINIVGQSMIQENKTKTKKSKKKYILIPLLIIILVCLSGISFYYIKIIKPENTYKQAIKLMNEGKYDDANSIFKEINSYKDVNELQDKLKYESYVFKCIDSLKDYLKNNDSLKISEVAFYKDVKSTITDNKLKIALENFKKLVISHPTCIIKYNAQNGFGGNNIEYAIFFFNSETKNYEYYGSCDSLNESELTDDNKIQTCKLINIFSDNFIQEGQVDLDRVSKILKNESYSAIKIIE